MCFLKSSCNSLNVSVDYYPGGMQMPNDNNINGDYRYAHNGMELDNEVSDIGNSYTTEFRQYDPRLGRWKSLDPLMAKFPWQSPFCSMDNNPIFHTDRYGNDVGYESKKDERRVKRKAFFNKEFRAEHQARVESDQLHIYKQVKGAPRLQDAQSKFMTINDFDQGENWVEYDKIGLGGFGGTFGGGGGLNLNLDWKNIEFELGNEPELEEKTIEKEHLYTLSTRKNTNEIQWRNKVNKKYKLNKKIVVNDASHPITIDAENIPDNFEVNDDNNIVFSGKLGGDRFANTSGNTTIVVPTSNDVKIKVEGRARNTTVTGGFLVSDNTKYTITYWITKGWKFFIRFKIPILKLK